LTYINTRHRQPLTLPNRKLLAFALR